MTEYFEHIPPPVFPIAVVRAYLQPIIFLIVLKENFAHALRMLIRWKFDTGKAYVSKILVDRFKKQLE